MYETYDTELQCRHAITRGVPVPKEWKGKLASRAGTPAVDEFAMKAVKRALVELGLGLVLEDSVFSQVSLQNLLRRLL